MRLIILIIKYVKVLSLYIYVYYIILLLKL